jgi:hypothetical protein
VKQRHRPGIAEQRVPTAAGGDAKRIERDRTAIEKQCEAMLVEEEARPIRELPRNLQASFGVERLTEARCIRRPLPDQHVGDARSRQGTADRHACEPGAEDDRARLRHSR